MAVTLYVALAAAEHDEVRMLINMHQEGEIAFQLHSLAQLQFIAGSMLLESRTYEA